MRLSDFAVAVFVRETSDPGQLLIPSPTYLRHLFEVLEEEIAKHVKAQQEAQAAAAAMAAAMVCDPAPARVDPSTGETLREIEHPTPAG